MRKGENISKRGCFKLCLTYPSYSYKSALINVLMSAVKNLFLIVAGSVFIGSCNNADQERKKVLMPNDVYRFYSISGEEGSDWVTSYFQFRRNGANGTPVVLTGPQKISLDGKMLKADSTVGKDFFYETQGLAQNFAGEHTISFVDKKSEEYRDKFVFSFFRLRQEPGEIVSRGNLFFEFEGLEDGDKLRVVITDTAFTSKGINEFYRIENGKLDLRTHLTGKIHNGPVLLQLFKETENPLKSAPGKGHIATSYSLKREFELKD